MPEPSLDVAIHVEGQGRGVYKLRPLAGGIVDGPNGPFEVQLGIDEPIDESAPAQPMRFSILVGD